MSAARRHENPLRALLLAQIHDLLAKLAERRELARAGDTAAAADEFYEVYLTVSPRCQPALFRPGRQPLRLLERQILEACTQETLTAKHLAGKLKRKCNSYFQEVLNDLWKRGLLEKTPRGFRAVSTR